MQDDLLLEPHYTHPCSEVTADHARHVILHQYVACLRIPNNWVVPTDAEATWLDVPAVVDILTGSCLWNPEFGYFRIASFDKMGQKVLVNRKDHASTAAPGTPVPSCTKFILAPDV